MVRFKTKVDSVLTVGHCTHGRSTLSATRRVALFVKREHGQSPLELTVKCTALCCTKDCVNILWLHVGKEMLSLTWPAYRHTCKKTVVNITQRVGGNSSIRRMPTTECIHTYVHQRLLENSCLPKSELVEGWGWVWGVGIGGMPFFLS